MSGSSIDFMSTAEESTACLQQVAGKLGNQGIFPELNQRIKSTEVGRYACGAASFVQSAKLSVATST